MFPFGFVLLWLPRLLQLRLPPTRHVGAPHLDENRASDAERMTRGAARCMRTREGSSDHQEPIYHKIGRHRKRRRIPPPHTQFILDLAQPLRTRPRKKEIHVSSSYRTEPSSPPSFDGNSSRIEAGGTVKTKRRFSSGKNIDSFIEKIRTISVRYFFPTKFSSAPSCPRTGD